MTSGMLSALNQISNKKIWILYEESEYNIQKTLEHSFGDKIKRKEVSVLKRKETDGQFICFYPNILVEFVERTETVFDRPITVLEGMIEFDAAVIKNKTANIIKDYEISFSLIPPKLPQKDQQKYNKTEKRNTAESYKKYKYKKKK